MATSELGFRLAMVEDMPENIVPGVLYVSEEYEIACHRCACGCDSLVYTPLGVTEWRFSEVDGKPSLSPSIGSWNLPCRSHYWIVRGRISWSGDWSDAQVCAGRKAETLRREAHFYKKSQPTFYAGIRGRLSRVWNWIVGR